MYITYLLLLSAVVALIRVFSANILFAQSFSLAGTILVACYGLPWILLLLLPLSMSYASVQR